MAPSGGSGVAGPGEGVELLGASPPIQETVSLRPRGPSGPWAVALLAVTLAMMGWWLFGGGGGDADAAPSSGGSDRSTTSTSRPGGDTGADRASTTTTNRRSDDTTASTALVVGDGGPLLGERSGWSLFFGTGGPLRQLDLDTGEVSKHQIAGRPMTVSGPWLVLQYGNGTILAVDVDDPDGDVRIELPTAGDHWVFAAHPGPQPGQAWLHEYTPGGPFARLVRLSDGAPLDEVRLSGSRWGLPGSIDGSVTTSPAGGVYAGVDGDYRLVSPAQLLAVADDVVLTQTCAGPNRCDLGWLDRGSWAPVPLAVPEPDSGGPTSFTNEAWVSPDGRVLVYGTTAGGYMFDVTRNDLVRSGVDPWLASASPDGRFVAAPETGQVHVYDVDEGENYLIDITTGPDSALVFAPAGG